MLRWILIGIAVALVAVLAIACSGGALGLPASDAASTLPTALPESALVAPGDAPAACDRALNDQDWQAAVSACERARRAAPADSAAAGRLSKAYLGRGRAVLSGGDVEAALGWFERAREAQPDSREATREYALAVAYRAAEVALAAGDRGEALAKFQAVYDGDRLYLTWLPERAARRRLADIEAEWGQELVAERAWGDAEAHCRAALEFLPDHEDGRECIAAIFRARTPTPTPSPTPTPTRTPGRGAPLAPVRPAAPVLPPRAAPVVPPRATPAPTSALPAVPTLGAPVAAP